MSRLRRDAWQAKEDPILSFQCHVGHSWEGERLLDLKSEQVEDALWASVRILKERAALTRQVASRARSGGDTERAARIDEQAALDDDRAESIRDLLDMTLAQIGAYFRDSKSERDAITDALLQWSSLAHHMPVRSRRA